jgi:hypothetical protein
MDAADMGFGFRKIQISIDLIAASPNGHNGHDGRTWQTFVILGDRCARLLNASDVG